MSLTVGKIYLDDAVCGYCFIALKTKLYSSGDDKMYIMIQLMLWKTLITKHIRQYTQSINSWCNNKHEHQIGVHEHWCAFVTGKTSWVVTVDSQHVN